MSEWWARRQAVKEANEAAARQAEWDTWMEFWRLMHMAMRTAAHRPDERES